MPTYSTGSKKYSDALLQTMDALAKISVESSSAKTLTLEAKITKVVDEGRGKYKVQYLDNVFYAYSSNEAIKYNVDDIVYIIVPEGNFDKRITILSDIGSEVSKLSVTEGDLYVPLGDSLFGNTYSGNLCSRREEYNTITGDKNFFAKTFTEYLKDNRTFSLSCNIRTEIEANRRSNGNYGLTLSIPVVDLNNVSSIYDVVLDINNIMGNAYNFNEKALQNLYFTVPDELSFDMSNLPALSLTAFVRDFPGQDAIDPATGQYIGDRIVDIWFSEIGVYPIKVVSRNEKEGYFLKARATEGSLFWGGGSSTKELYPDLYLGGRSTSADAFDCYWFKENSRIKVRTDGWHQYGGIGWQILNAKEPVNETETGQGNFNYIPQQRFPISIKEIHSEVRYKCVLVKDDTILTDIITIRNLIDPAEFTLTTDTGSTVYTKGIPNSKVILVVKYTDSDISDDASLQYEFTRLNQYGQLIDDKDDKGNYKEGIFKLESNEANEQVAENDKIYLVTKFSLPVKEIYNLNTITCTAYKSKQDTQGTEVSSEVVATTSITISTQKAPSFQIVLENADKVYKYDIDGDSPMVANYDGPVSSQIKAITPITARAYKQNGEEFTEDEYNIATITWKLPKNSMMFFDTDDLTEMRIVQPAEDATGQYYIISGSYPQLKNFYYSIYSVFSTNRDENTIRVNIKMQDISIDGMATIKFLKDGQSGTNGSKFTAVVGHGPTISEAKSYEEIEYIEIIDTSGSVTKVERFHKIQLVCVEAPSAPVRWFLYNSAKNEYKEFNDNIINDSDYADWIQFQAKLYCDGEPLDAGYTPSWAIFDYDNKYTNVVSPIRIDSGTGIIYIRHEDDNQNKGYMPWPAEEGQVCAAIVVATVQGSKANQDKADGSNAMFNEYVRAYYPIEVTYSKTLDIVIQKKIPQLNGGFYQALYNSNGQNPSYNSNKNFVFEDRLEKTASDLNNQSYAWDCSESIVMEDVPDENGDPKPLEKKVTPAGIRVPDGNGSQYVKVNYGYNISPQVLEPELEEYREKKKDLTYQKMFYENIEAAAQIFRHFQDMIYDNVYKTIIGNDNLLIIKNRVEEFFLDIMTRMNALMVVNRDILSQLGSDYLLHLCNNSNGVYLLLANEILHVGEKRYTIQEIKNYFADYGQLENVFLDTGDGHYKGVFADLSLFRKNNASNFYVSGSDKNRRDEFKAELNVLMEEIKQFYEGNHNNGYYYQIVDDTGDFTNSFNIFRYVQNMLRGYLYDLRNPNTHDYDEDNGVNTYEDVFSEELVSRWDVLTTEFVYIDEDGNGIPDYIIENPYYNKFAPIYSNIDVIISNLKENKFSSFDNIILALDKLSHELSLYYDFNLVNKIQECESALSEINKKIIGLEELEDNYGTSSLIHVKPIVMLFNPTATWLDWDGNKIQINEDGAYIAAPMFAAGKRESDGSFTGLTMGVQREEVDKSVQRTGLLGHYKGQQSLFIDAETGKAEFGLQATGQIKIDPQAESLRIYDSYYETTQDKGMCINFAERQLGSKTVSSSIHFKNATGIIYSGRHDSQGSSEEGFYLSHDGFSIGANVHINRNGTFIFGNMNKNNGQYIEWNGSIFEIGDKVKVTASAIDANLSISCGNGTFRVNGSDGSLYAGSGAFTVSKNNTGTWIVNIANNVNIGTSGEGNININGILKAREGSWIGNWKIKEGGKLLGYINRSYGDSTDGKDYSTIRLDPYTSRIGLYTGATLPSTGNHDFVWIGTSIQNGDEAIQNTVCVYDSNSSGNLANFQAEIVKSKRCAMATNYIYIGTRNKDFEGMAADGSGHAIRIENNGDVETAVWDSRQKKYNWVKKCNLLSLT